MTPDGALAAFFSQHYAFADKHLTVGFSGGLDSSVLLHALLAMRARLGCEIEAVHVHHGLSVHADEWAAHCRTVCQHVQVPLQVIRVQVRQHGQGLEAAARLARYRVFAGLHTDAVVLAHHRDDQSETVLLQMLRGGSVKAMAAMPAVRALTDTIQLLRPLLAIPRSALETYARMQALSWVEDESNHHLGLTRNRLRHRVLPVLDAEMPGTSQRLSVLAEQCAEWSELLDALALADGAEEAAQQGLSRAVLQALPEVRARNLLRRVLELRGVNVRRDALRELLRQLRGVVGPQQIRVDFGEWSALCFREKLHVVRRTYLQMPPALSLPWRGEPLLDLGPGGQVHFSFSMSAQGAIRLPLTVGRLRYRQVGDRFRFTQGQAPRALKDWLREAEVPYWLRPWLPVLEVDGQIAWVAGLGVAAEFRPEPGVPAWIISWQPPV